MAKKNQVYIDIIVDDDGSTKRVAVDAKKLGIELKKAGGSTKKVQKDTDALSNSQKNLDRNMRGTAKMAGNSTKEFSKMQQGMGGLVGAYATLAAQVFAVSAAFQFLQSASNIKNLINGQEALGSITGTAYKTITNSIIAATDAQLNYSDAAKAAAIGTAAGLTSGQLEKLGTVAKNASFALGRDLTDSFNRLVRGVTKAEPELLDELGIILRLDSATAKYAEKMGVAQNSLTAFQRSQAVANEVLEQGTRKFAAVEAMMSKDAAALAQFTKSFDDLFNMFKTGIISVLAPVLQFLSKNTLALTASLALFAIPIVKSILPNLDAWQTSQKKTFRGHQEDSARYIDDTMNQANALKELDDNQTQLNKNAKKGADRTKKDTSKGGVGYVTGGPSSPQARAAAKKGLKLAEDDLRKHTRVQNGIFKGYTAKEVALARASYNKRIALEKTFWQKRKLNLDRGLVRTKMYYKQVLLAHKAFQMQMGRVAEAGARVLNGVMKLAGLIGVFLMLKDAAVMLWNYFNPIGAAAERQAEKIEGLTDKYKDLGEEMEKAANARQRYTSGSMDATSLGQTMQSADVENLISTINFMATMKRETEAQEEAFQDLQTKMLPVVKVLGNTNEGFVLLGRAMAKGNEITAKQGQGMLKIAADYTEVGARIANLPETMGKANAAFTSLSKGLGQSNPLDQFIDYETAVLADLALRLAAAETKRDILAIESDNFQSYADRQLVIDKQFFADRLAEADNAHSRLKARQEQAYFFKQKEETRVQLRTKKSMKRREIGAFVDDLPENGTTAINQLDPDAVKTEREDLTYRQETTDTQIASDDTSLDERTIRHGEIVKLRGRQLVIAKRQAKIELIASKTVVRGITHQGKLLNIQQKRVVGSKAIRDAEAALDLAEVNKATQKEGLSDQEKQNNIDLISLAKKRLEQARQNEVLAEEARVVKEGEIRQEMRLLGLRNEILARNREITRERMAQVQRSAMGGGSFGSSARNRISEGDQLAAAQTSATQDVTILRERREKQVRDNAKEGRRIARGPGRMNQLGFKTYNYISPDQHAEINATAQAESPREALDSAIDTKTGADNALTLHRSIFDIKTKSMAKEMEILEIQGKGGGFLKEQQITAAAILELKEAGHSVTQEETAQIEALSVAQADAQRMNENMKGLGENLQQGLAGAFESMITGAKSAKEAFADMAKSTLMYLAKIIAQELALKVVRGAMGMFGFADGGITPSQSLAKGGYSLKRNNYARGGTARGAQSGYAATLHGNEAVVPLPDNRSIPVTLNGAGGQNNNVTVNVAMGGDGQSQQNSQGDSNMAANIGKMVAGAVQEELQYQKRSGGILNPYGAS